MTTNPDIRRWDVINHLILQNGYQTYLEIGSTGSLDNPSPNLWHILAPNRVGVDPKGNPAFRMKSHEFFEMIPRDCKFDIIFIDGQHTEDAVLEDIRQAIFHLQPHGAIVVHDCNPPTEAHSINPGVWRPKDPGYYVWTGTVYKGFIWARVLNDMKFRCVDVDWGCGVITHYAEGEERDVLLGIKNPPADFAEFAAHREEYLGLISWEQFVEEYTRHPAD